MKFIKLKVARIGNSRGVRPLGPATPELSWEKTAHLMAAEREDWSDWDVTLADGMDDIPWQPGKPRRVAERVPEHARRSRRKR